jgi:NAD(P)-dependent dehydrogenase (short-subunit alcohol dehydrogenase family)
MSIDSDGGAPRRQPGAFDLGGKVAVITGAASGIGQSIALKFAEQGARIAAVDLTRESLADTAAQVRKKGGQLDAFAADVSSAAAVDAAFAAIRGAFGRIDILVNNAGVGHVGTVLDTDEETFDRLYRVNVKGVFLCTKAAMPTMLEQGGGVILNLASIASFIALEDRFAYSMTKGAVLTMTRSVAIDFVKRGIRCNCMCPARIHTPFVDGYLAKSYPGREAEMFKKLSDYQPIGRMGRPDEVANLALYLCSDEAAFVTGAAFPIDGGVLAV